MYINNSDDPIAGNGEPVGPNPGVYTFGIHKVIELYYKYEYRLHLDNLDVSNNDLTFIKPDCYKIKGSGMTV